MVSTPELGALIGGKYRIVRALGVGGMGAVYEAEHVITGKRCAVKWLHPLPGARASDRQRAIHEARAACRIHHENVVDVYDVVEHDEAIYLVMELLTGEPLSALLARAPLAPHALIALLLPAMRGMIAVHEAGVVHRDVKPHNIFLADEPGHRDKVPKIIDFGVSKVLEVEAEGIGVSHAGVTLGTPRYMSYEQLLGHGDVDARTDVYAFGVILYEALTGEAPYGEAQSLGDLGVRFATTTPAPPHKLQPSVPEGLSDVVMRAIARDREARIGSMGALVAALLPFAEPDALRASNVSETLRPRGLRRSLPSRRRWAAPSLAALALAGAFAAFVLLGRSAVPERSPPSVSTSASSEVGSAPPALSAPMAPTLEVPADTAPAPAGEAAPSSRPARKALPRAARVGVRERDVQLGRDAGGGAVLLDERHRAGELRREEF